MIANIRMWMLALRTLCTLCTLCVFSAQAQMKPEYDMGRMQLTLLNAQGEAPTDAEAKAQADALRSLLESGKIAAAGPVTEAGNLRGLVLVKTEKPEEAAAIIAELPLVKAGKLKPEPLTWFAARAFIKPITKVEKETRYVFGMLVAGPATGHTPEEIKTIQAGHMAHINTMHEAGKLAIAGPFAGGGARRGVFLFKLDSLEAAQALAADDPAVKAGRLKLETFYWTVPTGIFP
ncbi:MAG: YciI family protein [Burkholderiales bacterium]|nr:YciI family protein [Burkholderiales bacterium]